MLVYFAYLCNIINRVIINIKGGAVMGGKTSNESKRKYNEKAYDRIQLVVKKGKKEIIKEAAENIGMTLNGFVNAAIDEKIQQTNSKSTPDGAEREE